MARLQRLWLAAFALAAIGAAADASWADGPAPPTGVTAKDKPWDVGGAVVVSWTPPTTPVESYQIFRWMDAAEIKQANRDARVAAAAEAAAEVRERLTAEGVAPEDVRLRALDAGKAAAAALQATQEDTANEPQWTPVAVALGSQTSVVVDRLSDNFPGGYRFQVIAIGADGTRSVPAETAVAVTPSRQPFDGGRLWLAIITVVLCGAVLFFISAARRGMPLKIRKIAGLAAVDEAVGRATEMGRPVLFIPGTQDMNEIQTLAGITVLARVGKTAAEYDAQVEVPTSRSLVMTAARETMHAAYLQAGRPDAFNPDLVYYVTDEQFGFVAYLSGMMVREKPAACFYMGAFFAESLILAETGNSVGAIQIAGTAQPAQLPFFVAACDYTLIGEEFFAASAYLSGEPDQLGSLKGQDVGKLIVAGLMVAGCLIATAAAITNNATLESVLAFLKDTMLT